MKLSSTKRAASCATLALLALTPACHHHSRIVPVYQESESNDTPATADYFGVLDLGDQLVIEGVIGDPFIDIDGFAFTAARPIHVDFQLFADRDLDVCLYDPLIDETVACFATADHPERGGVDVLAGGLDFHLTVEACIEPGCAPAPGTPYTLELTVHHLFLATAEEGDAAGLDRAASPASSGVRGIEARVDPERVGSPAASRRYRQAVRGGTEVVPQVILEERIEILRDEETDTTTILRVLRASGS